MWLLFCQSVWQRCWCQWITKIEKLNRRNYQSWKYNMKLIFLEHGSWSFTQEGQETPPAADTSAAVKNVFCLRSDKAYLLIALNMEKDLQIHTCEFVSITQIVCLNHAVQQFMFTIEVPQRHWKIICLVEDQTKSFLIWEFLVVWIMYSVHVPESQRRKLDANTHKAVFVRYPPSVKGYKVYDLEKKKFVVSQDVQ